MDNIYLSDYSAAHAQRRALHDVEEQGRVRQLRTCTTENEGKMEVRACVKHMLESRLALARDSVGVDREGVLELAEALLEKMQSAERHGEIVDIHRIMAEIYAMDPGESIQKRISALGHSLHNLGVSWRNLGKYSEAADADQEAVKLRRELVIQDPDRYTSDLAYSLHKLGIDLGKLGKHAEAIDADEEAVKLRRELVTQDPDRYTSHLADSLQNLGVHLRNLDKHAEAVDADEEAVKLRRELVTQNPGRYTSVLANSLHNLGAHLRKLNEIDRAKKVEQEEKSHRQK